MKRLTEKQAQKIAIKFIYSVENIWQNKLPKLDRRFTVNQLALNIIRKNNLSYTEIQRIKNTIQFQ